MNRRASIVKIFGRMTASGFILGGIAGSLVILTFTLVHVLTENTAHFTLIIVLASVIWSFIAGAMFGSLFGGMSGFFCGLIMAIVSTICFREIRRPQFYKFSMGLLTFIISSYILFAGWDVLFSLQDSTFTLISALAMSVVIAVYVSQITARNYIYEMSVRKGKMKD